MKQQESTTNTNVSPPYLERHTIINQLVYSEFYLSGELRNLCIKIHLIESIQYDPIYVETIKELCVKNPKRKPKDPPIFHVLGTLSDLILGEKVPVRYDKPRNPVVTIEVQGHNFPKTLVDLGYAINILTLETCGILGIIKFKTTTIMLELADISILRPKGTMEDFIISMNS